MDCEEKIQKVKFGCIAVQNLHALIRFNTIEITEAIWRRKKADWIRRICEKNKAEKNKRMIFLHYI